MYSSGDFLDDYAVDDVLRNDQSFLFLVTINKKGPKALRLIPVMIKNMQVNKAEGIQAQMMLQRIKELSSRLGAFIK